MIFARLSGRAFLWMGFRVLNKDDDEEDDEDEDDDETKGSRQSFTVQWPLTFYSPN